VHNHAANRENKGRSSWHFSSTFPTIDSAVEDELSLGARRRLFLVGLPLKY